MNSPLIQLIVLAAIAIFLILRLRDVLGTREGFEKPQIDQKPAPAPGKKDRFEVIEGGPDSDITDHVPADSDAAKALAAMKLADGNFIVSDFLSGASGAYEMILMAFEKGDLASIRPFLSDEIHEAFEAVIAEREAKGLIIDAEFVGMREMKLVDATFNRATNLGEVTIRFVGELTSVVRDKAGDIIEGNPKEIKRQRDVWTFAREMGSANPNWQLVATGE